jgi:hypothetical protein
MTRLKVATCRYVAALPDPSLESERTAPGRPVGVTVGPDSNGLGP